MLLLIAPAQPATLPAPLPSPPGARFVLAPYSWLIRHPSPDTLQVFGNAALQALLDADALSVHSLSVRSLKAKVPLQSKVVSEPRLRDIVRVQGLVFEDPDTVKNLGQCNGGAYHHMHGPDILNVFQLV